MSVTQEIHWSVTFGPHDNSEWAIAATMAATKVRWLKAQVL